MKTQAIRTIRTLLFLLIVFWSSKNINLLKLFFQKEQVFLYMPPCPFKFVFFAKSPQMCRLGHLEKPELMRFQKVALFSFLKAWSKKSMLNLLIGLWRKIKCAELLILISGWLFGQKNIIVFYVSLENWKIVSVTKWSKTKNRCCHLRVLFFSVWEKPCIFYHTSCQLVHWNPTKN